MHLCVISLLDGISGLFNLVSDIYTHIETFKSETLRAGRRCRKWHCWDPTKFDNFRFGDNSFCATSFLQPLRHGLRAILSVEKSDNEHKQKMFRFTHPVWIDHSSTMMLWCFTMRWVFPSMFEVLFSIWFQMQHIKKQIPEIVRGNAVHAWCFIERNNFQFSWTAWHACLFLAHPTYQNQCAASKFAQCSAWSRFRNFKISCKIRVLKQAQMLLVLTREMKMWRFSHGFKFFFELMVINTRNGYFLHLPLRGIVCYFSFAFHTLLGTTFHTIGPCGNLVLFSFHFSFLFAKFWIQTWFCNGQHCLGLSRIAFECNPRKHDWGMMFVASLRIISAFRMFQHRINVLLQSS